MAEVILADGLTKSYGSRRGVIDLTFSVSPGEVFGYLGPNGAGKTTTIRTLLDLIRPTTGRALVFGLDSHRDAVRIHARVGYLPGEFSLYDQMTGAEYLAYLASLRGGVPAERVAELAERLDVDLSARIRTLSHGNRQKIGLIQAFMHRPELLILDEPTQGLDPLIQHEFSRLIEEARAEGRTVFLSSHVMPEVERVCDRVGIIREGRLVAVEEIGDLRAKELRTLEIRFAAPVPPDAFAGVPGVREAAVSGDAARVTVAGPMDAVIKRIAAFEVVDLTSHEPSLEEIFLTFYGKGEDGYGKGEDGGD
ncbi:putative ABC transporter ATP-binding protein YbhF [bacterium HR12]|nr:putative ABC transporter ATP-binding protein YbhF [bacterium HR12]